MNILVVDDQRAVADSIANGIAYKENGYCEKDHDYRK